MFRRNIVLVLSQPRSDFNLFFPKSQSFSFRPPKASCCLNSRFRMKWIWHHKKNYRRGCWCRSNICRKGSFWTVRVEGKSGPKSVRGLLHLEESTAKITLHWSFFSQVILVVALSTFWLWWWSSGWQGRSVSFKSQVRFLPPFFRLTYRSIGQP